MGFSTPAGKDLATKMWCVLDAAGFDGVDEEGEPDGGRDRSGYRLASRGHKVEVCYEAGDELFATSWEPGADHPGHAHHPAVLFRRRIETVMLGAIAEVLMAAGFGFTHHPAADGRPAVLLVQSGPAPGIL